MCTPLLLLLLVASGQQPDEAAALVNRAIEAAGGAHALAAVRGVEWTATGTLHTPEGATPIEGRWIIDFHDRADVTTWERASGKASARRILLEGTAGWIERGGARIPLSAPEVAHARDQVFLASVLRLLPLRDAGVELSVIAPGRILVRHPARPDLEATFRTDGRLARLQTTISHPVDNSDIVQQVVLEGTISAGGVTWPRTIRVTQDGKPFLDLELTSVVVLENTQENGRKGEHIWLPFSLLLCVFGRVGRGRSASTASIVSSWRARRRAS